MLTGVVQGSRIQTALGECRVEHLQAGDQIATADGTAARLSSITRTACRASGTAAPVKIHLGGVGNHRDIVVAPGQLLSVNGTLLAAHVLADQALGETAYGGIVTYYQLNFEHDVLVSAEGAILAFGREDQTLAPQPIAPPVQVAQVRLI